MKAFDVLNSVSFPVAAGININMMPFIYGDMESIPLKYRDYAPMIEACGAVEQTGKVCYLSVSESFVVKGKSQRRPGLHTEGHSSVGWGSGGWGASKRSASGSRDGGLYMASTVDASCRMWDTQILNPGHMGDVEHLRDSLDRGILMNSNRLYWLTDRTPHEALPADSDTYRQWFRLVTSDVSVWYKQHSTENPLGIKPSKDTLILNENKFG